jgi:small nuclear ribonucleoprotein (snRNP)-like protein
LLCFVQALVGLKTIVELRDDVAIKGTLVDVDDRMNCTLSDAVRRTPEGTTMNLDVVYVNARLIRFVHVPKEIDPSALIEKKRLEQFEAARHYQRLAAFGPRNPQKTVDHAGG